MELILLEGTAGQTEPATAYCKACQRQAKPQVQLVKGYTLFKFIELENRLKQQNINPGSL